MKKLFISLTLLLTLSCCDKDNDKPKTELEKLTVATQTGANKIGCLLDGKAFLPDKYPNSKDSVYKFIGNANDFFSLPFDVDSDGFITILATRIKNRADFRKLFYRCFYHFVLCKNQIW